MNKCLRIGLLVVSTVLFLASCDLPVKSAETTEDPDKEFNPQQTLELDVANTSLFTKEESGTDSNGSYTFKTNDKRYLVDSGYTIWTSPFTQLANQQIEVEMTKKHGNQQAGYGVVFYRQKDKEGKDYFFTVLLNTKGQYCIGKIMEGRFTYITKWKQASCIHAGYGIKNVIKISNNIETGKSILTINDIEVDTFNMEENVKIAGSSYGFVTVISNLENFPADSVEVEYINKCN